MKSLRIVLFCLLIHSSSYGQFNMPPFKEVATAFFSQYRYEPYDHVLKFQRKKDGWYVAEMDYSATGNYTNTQIFWSKRTGKYTVLNFPAATGDSASVIQAVNKYLEQIFWETEEYNYQRNKYYGYPGWAWDVINDEETHLTDSLLESRGRAYFNYAYGFIGQQFGEYFMNNDRDRIPVTETEKISSSGKEKFIGYEMKAIADYEELIKINPGYNTRVGNIRVKLANEYMFLYMQMMLMEDPLRAKAFALKAEYPDSLLNTCKAYLTALPAHSILITNGDNDTYPVWYLQEIKNYRRDVTVLNYSMLGVRRYLPMINQLNGQPLFSAKDTARVKKNFDYSAFNNNSGKDTSIDVKTFLAHLEKNYNPYDSYTQYDKEPVRRYYAKSLYFKMPGNRKSKTFPLRSYLLMPDYLLLDIVNTSGKRGVFFTVNDNLLSPLLGPMGSVFELKYEE